MLAAAVRIHAVLEGEVLGLVGIEDGLRIIAQEGGAERARIFIHPCVLIGVDAEGLKTIGGIFPGSPAVMRVHEVMIDGHGGSAI